MIEVYCDGGARGNPGPAAFGFVIKEDGRLIKLGKGAIGVATNNIAEYTALIEALTWLKDYHQGQDLNFYLDSKLVVSQLLGLYKVKSPHIGALVLRVKELEKNFGKINYQHIPRDQNQEADSLVNEVLDGA